MEAFCSAICTTELEAGNMKRSAAECGLADFAGGVDFEELLSDSTFKAMHSEFLTTYDSEELKAFLLAYHRGHARTSRAGSEVAELQQPTPASERPGVGAPLSHAAPRPHTPPSSTPSSHAGPHHSGASSTATVSHPSQSRARMPTNLPTVPRGHETVDVPMYCERACKLLRLAVISNPMDPAIERIAAQWVDLSTNLQNAQVPADLRLSWMYTTLLVLTECLSDRLLVSRSTALLAAQMLAYIVKPVWKVMDKHKVYIQHYLEKVYLCQRLPDTSLTDLAEKFRDARGDSKATEALVKLPYEFFKKHYVGGKKKSGGMEWAFRTVERIAHGLCEGSLAPSKIANMDFFLNDPALTEFIALLLTAAPCQLNLDKEVPTTALDQLQKELRRHGSGLEDRAAAEMNTCHFLRLVRDSYQTFVYKTIEWVLTPSVPAHNSVFITAQCTYADGLEPIARRLAEAPEAVRAQFIQKGFVEQAVQSFASLPRMMAAGVGDSEEEPAGVQHQHFELLAHILVGWAVVIPELTTVHQEMALATISAIPDAELAIVFCSALIAALCGQVTARAASAWQAVAVAAAERLAEDLDTLPASQVAMLGLTEGGEADYAATAAPRVVRQQVHEAFTQLLSLAASAGTTGLCDVVTRMLYSVLGRNQLFLARSGALVVWSDADPATPLLRGAIVRCLTGTTFGIKRFPPVLTDSRALEHLLGTVLHSATQFKTD
eukprot:Hpha_TRINITY_DN16396_c1_g9::TRINITY_DN16396_c1_g9_i1::g.61063::m.61063